MSTSRLKSLFKSTSSKSSTPLTPSQPSNNLIKPEELTVETPPPNNQGLLEAAPRPSFSQNPPRILIIGAGSRGNAYARATVQSSNGILAAVAEPIAYKRQKLGEKYIWKESTPKEGQQFSDWKEFLEYELRRREREKAGENVEEGIDAVFICVQDEQHKEVILGLQPLELHVMCEKPLSTSLEDCVAIYKSLLPNYPVTNPSRIVSIGHVLRYSPHNMLLRKLLLEDRVIGDVLSVNHTEPVGWWHFTHSYVRGNWRRESTSAPSLLTKSCHDIDVLLWLLCSPPDALSDAPPHLPESITSTGSRQYFRKSRKPKAAGKATNCFSCPIEQECKYSAKSIYVSNKHKGLGRGNTNWPVDIVLPDIEDIIKKQGLKEGEDALISKLQEDYDENTPVEEVRGRNWFGRCVYEADNDVCDDQVVTMKWDESPLKSSAAQDDTLQGRGAKTAIFHMTSHTAKICERYTHIYGVEGEIYADSSIISVTSFQSPSSRPQIYRPHMAGGGHGGGDDGLARQFILAVDKVKNGGMSVKDAQARYVGCSLEEVIRSHAVVFAAEEARTQKKVVQFEEWWERNVVGMMGGLEEELQSAYD